MLSAKEIFDLQKESDYGVNQVEAIFEQTNAIIEKIKSDTTRSDKWKEDEIKRNIEKLTPSMGIHLNLIKEIAKKAVDNQPFWESKLFLLSLQKFSEEPEKDALIRLAHSEELSALPLPLIDLKLKNALSENNLAFIFQCWKVGTKIVSQSHQTGKNERGIIDLTLEGVVIPDQDAALEAIKKCWSNIGRAESILQQFFGREQMPLERLKLARQQMPLAK